MCVVLSKRCGSVLIHQYLCNKAKEITVRQLQLVLLTCYSQMDYQLNLLFVHLISSQIIHVFGPMRIRYSNLSLTVMQSSTTVYGSVSHTEVRYLVLTSFSFLFS